MRLAEQKQLARLFIGLLCGLSITVGGAGHFAPPLAAQAPGNQAGLVILHGDGRVVTACVAFDEAQITGLQLLQRSGLDLSVDAGNGNGAVCRINGEGCSVPQQSCFCQCEGANCSYWSYWQASTSGWQYANLGASSFAVKPGQVEGWVWGAGTVENARQPPTLSFADVCSSAPATATPTSTPTSAPTGTSTATSTATATPANTSTSTPVPLAAPQAMGGPPRIEWFAADRTQLGPGEGATLSWRVVDAASVVLLAGGQTVPVGAVGSTTLAPPGSVEIRLEARNNSGVSSSIVQLSVGQPAVNQPTVNQPTVSQPVVSESTVNQPVVGQVSAVTPAPVAGATTTAIQQEVAIALEAQPTAPLTIRLMLPLVMLDTGLNTGPGRGQATRVQPPPPGTAAALVGTVEAAGALPVLAAATVPTEGVTPTPAAAAVLPAAVVDTVLPPAAAAPLGNATGAASSQLPAAANLVWMALAALLLLPAGIATLGYLIWRLIRPQ